MLEVRDLNVWYGRTEILRSVSFDVPRGETTALLGGNGSGKTTILNTLTGLVRPRSGSIALQGVQLAGKPPAHIIRSGMVQVPQGREVFASMTVLDNLRLGAATRRDRAAIEGDLDDSFAMFPRLKEKQSRLAGSLSGGEQQQVAIARSLMAQPALLLMDEPSAGLSPAIVEGLVEMIHLLKSKGLTILLVEQNVGVAARTARQAHVLQEGRIVHTEDAADLIGNERVLASYLGG
jgi:branched-chain amino acid transport system ATP-binding protein